MSTPSDEDARRRVRTDWEHNLVVEAGAGTGKTTLIVERTVEAVASGRTTLARLAVLTYLENAAAELRLRIQAALVARRQTEDDPRVGDRLDRALVELPDARVGTLHGLGQGILLRHAVTLGIAPNLEVWDAVEQERQESLAFAAFLAQAPDFVRQALRDSVRLGLSYQQWRSLVRQAGRLPEERMDWGPAPEPTPDLLAAWRATVRELATVIDHVAPDPEDAGVRQIRGMARDLEALGHLPPHMQTAHLYGWELKAPAGSQARWRGHPDALRAQKAALKDLMDRHRRWQQAVAAAAIQPLVETGHLFREYFWQWRRDRRAVIFEDQVERVASGLAENPDLRADVAATLDAIVIDEFQDTDPRQMDIVRWLAAGSERQADPDRPPPGRLTVVGDPKQSIYGFRGADVRHALEWTRRLVATGYADLVPITVNFRSQPAVIETVNALFDPLFAQHRGGYDPDYRALTPFRPAGAARVAAISVHGRADEVQEQQTRREADALLGVIQQAMGEQWPVGDDAASRPLAYADIAVLLPQRTGLDVYRRRLEEAGIPVHGGGRRGFYRRDDIRGLAAILRAAVLPEDQTAVLAALRSPWLGIPDEALALHAAQGGRWHPREAGTVRGLAADGLAWLNAVAQGWADGGAEAVLEQAVRIRLDELSPDEDANVGRLIDQARRYQERWGTVEYAHWLWARVVAGDDGEEANAADAADGVRFTTVHQAKGLEWPMVVVVNLGRRLNPSRQWVLHDRNAGAWAVRVGRHSMANWEAVRASLREQEEAERRRLWYVALTRARDHLIILESDPHRELFQHWPGVRADPGTPTARARVDQGWAASPQRPVPRVPEGALPSTRPRGHRQEDADRRAVGRVFHLWAARSLGEAPGRREELWRQAPEGIQEALAWLGSRPWLTGRRLRTEVPVTMTGPPLHRGVIDLVIEGAAWTVVEYRTEQQPGLGVSDGPGGQGRLHVAALRASGIPVERLLVVAPFERRWWEVPLD